MNRRRVLASVLGLAVLPLLGVAKPALAVDPPTAVAFTQNMLDDLVRSVAGRKLTRAECSGVMSDLLARYVDLQGTSAALLGPAWQRMAEPDREYFVTTLLHYMTAIWSANLGELSPQRRFVVQHGEPLGSRMVVHAVTTAPGDDPVPLEFQLVTGPDGQPRLADMAFAGISVVRMLRADFNSVLFANSGRVEALLAAMKKKVELAALQ